MHDPFKITLCSTPIPCLRSLRLLTVAIGLKLVFVNCAHSEFSCSAEVSYSYKKGGDGAAVEVRVREVRAVGPTEPAAKSELNRWLIREVQKAGDVCEKKAAVGASCLPTRLTALSSTLSSLDFTARKALIEEIAKECGGTKESCLGARASEVKCEEVVATPAPGAAEEEKKEEGDKKGKKK